MYMYQSTSNYSSKVDPDMFCSCWPCQETTNIQRSLQKKNNREHPETIGMSSNAFKRLPQVENLSFRDIPCQHSRSTVDDSAETVLEPLWFSQLEPDR